MTDPNVTPLTPETAGTPAYPVNQAAPQVPVTPDPKKSITIELQKAEEELAEAQRQVRIDRQKKAALEAPKVTVDTPITTTVSASVSPTAAEKAALEAQAKTNLDREKKAKIDYAKKHSAYHLEQSLAAIEAEYAVPPVSAAGACPKCKSTATVFSATGKVCNSCGHHWVEKAEVSR